ncbi:MAG: hypothetical protein SPL13_00600 [Clostridia bacterium]|nr:hypothetical protein [Clostridia bacterium]
MKTRVLTLSAISASFVALFLTLGAYIEFIDLLAVIIASIFVLLPIYYESYLGCFLTYLAGGALAFIISQFNFLSLVFPLFFGFFGLYPFLMCMSADKKFNRILFIVLSLIWCIAATYGTYFYYTLIMKNILEGLPEFIVDNIYIVLFVLGVIVYFLFDRFVFSARILINRYLGKVIKK